MFLPALLGGVALPMLTSLRTPGSTAQYQRVLWTNVKASSAAALLMAIPIAVMSPWIMASYGSGFSEGKWVLVILCVSSVAASADWIIGQSLFSKGRVWFKFGLNGLWATIFFGAAFFLHDKGAEGLAIAYLLADYVRLATILTLMNGSRTALWTRA